jgi:hypothetical protein
LGSSKFVVSEKKLFFFIPIPNSSDKKKNVNIFPIGSNGEVVSGKKKKKKFPIGSC